MIVSEQAVSAGYPAARGMAARRFISILAVCALAGCQSTEERATNEEKAAAARKEAGLREPFVKPMSRSETETFFVGKTRLVSAFNRGVQISYMAPDGSAYLWFPGNPVVLRGQWSIKETGGYRPYAGRPVSEISVCFRYGANTVNAWSGEHEAESCAPGTVRSRLTLEGVDGDVFGLSKRTEVPFVLPPERTTLADVRKRAGAR